MTQKKSLPPNQERFVAEYLIDLNATQAAIRAGYSAKTAKVQGSRLLTKAAVSSAISEGKAKRTSKVEITQERVLRELDALAHSSVTHYQVNEETGQLELAEGAPENAMAAVASIKYRTRTERRGYDTDVIRECEFKLWDKPGTLKLAGRHVAVPGFFDKFELTGKDGAPLNPPQIVLTLPKNGRDVKPAG